MINALKDYNEMVWKPSCKWIKKHWKGYVFFIVILEVLYFMWFYWSSICDYFKSKFDKKSEKES